MKVKLITTLTTIARWPTASVALVGSRRPRRGLRSHSGDPLPARRERGIMLGAQRSITRTVALGARCELTPRRHWRRLSLACAIIGVLVGPSTALASSGWSAPAPVDPAFHATSVSCPSASFCAAVDQAGDVAMYNGSTWSTPANIDANKLNSVSCPSTSFCVAVSNSGDAIKYNGSTWGTPASIDGFNLINSVSCVSSSFCVAVDFHGNALTYNGTSWSSAASIDGRNRLNSVS